MLTTMLSALEQQLTKLVASHSQTSSISSTAPPSLASSCQDLEHLLEAPAASPAEECCCEGEDYGYFETEDAYDSECSETSMEAVQREHREQLKNTSAHSGDCTVQFRAHNPAFILSTKCFDSSTQCFAWGIGGFRIVRTANGKKHAEYQVLASYGDCTFTRWIRSSAMGRFAHSCCEERGWAASTKAWGQVKDAQRVFRCLEVNYLLNKCHLLENFLRLALFDAGDAAPLLQLVCGEQ